MIGSADSKGRVLIADDEAALARTYARILAGVGYRVDVAPDGETAATAVKSTNFDVIVSDIAMPGMNGLQLLRTVRERDLDVPVILMTGSPAIDTAVHALEYGALRYLLKPIEESLLLEVVGQAVQLHRLARLKRQALALNPEASWMLGDRGGLEAGFERALSSLWMAYQPLVSYERKQVLAFEALMRSPEPTLPTPGAILQAAERLDRLHDLGRAVRAAIASTAETAPSRWVFVNLHPHDLLDDTLYDPASPLSKVAHRIVLEITERATLDEVADTKSRVARLRDLGFRIALDDLGAGYAGLTSFALLEPDVVKIDMPIIRDVHLLTTKQKVIRSLAELCRDMGMMVVAEGVENAEERDGLLACGCDVLQGYFFAKPGRPFPQVVW
jgi:EAL domain-containing protein (putative c-di-GMP-specific phosphodiesterase class I)